LKFDPLRSSAKIVEDFRRYILTTFRTDDSRINSGLEKAVGIDTISNGPYLSVSPNYERKCALMSLVPDILSQGFNDLPKSTLDPRKFILYKHQYEAIDTVVSRDHNMVLSTGTSSGKTFSFLLPILNYLLEERENGTLSDGVRAMIIYPMNALANDQMNELRGMLKGTGITFGAFTGETKATQKDALRDYERVYDHPPDSNELISREVMNARPPNILITNYAMLERLLILPDHKELFGRPGSNHWKYIVLDEAHMYSGAKGSEVSSLLRRLKGTIGREEIRFLLTSATLGGTGDASKVVSFANELCGTEDSGCPFTESDLVTSSFHEVVPPENLESLDDSFYLGLAECIDQGRTDEEMVDDIIEYLDGRFPGDGPYRERLFDVVSKDPRVYKLKSYLEGCPRSTAQIEEFMGMDPDFLVAFVRVISLAEHDGYRLFDSKYHMFVKSIDGVFTTLTDDPHVFVHKCVAFDNPESGREERVFEISTCYNCGHMYLVGKIDGGEFKQTSTNEDVIKDSVFMVMRPEEFDEEAYTDDELQEDVKLLCPICGAADDYAFGLPCGHGRPLYLFQAREEDTKICTCRNCGQKEYRRGMLRQMYLGYDSSTAVISTSLYGQMYGNADHRFLSFSDNRQSAAYFASYMDSAYWNIMLHAAMYYVIMDNESELSSSGMSLKSFHKKLEGVINENMLYSEKEEDGRTSASADSWLMLFIDAAKYDSNKSFEHLGQIYYEYSPTNPVRIDGLTEDESRELMNQVVKIVRDRVAINRPSDLSTESWFDYYRREPGSVVCTSKDRKNGEDVLVTKRIKKYFEIVTGSPDGASVGRKILKCLEIPKSPKNGRFVDYNKLRVRRKPYVYRCTNCLKRTPFSVKGYCYRCGTQTLVREDTSHLDENDAYAYNYAHAPLMAMRIKEHTAQLDKDRAREYQARFRDGDLDALSCSTTFEVGVNIGNLNTVLLRNVPPTPASYIQRVGRAGRSPESSAYSITYCKNSPHDAYYFHNPMEMVQGKVPVPSIKADNTRIVIRHIFASALSFFWKNSMYGYSNHISDFMADYDNLKDYLDSKPADLLDFLKLTVPRTVHNYASVDNETDLTIDLENFVWVEELIDDERGRLKQCKADYDSDLGSLDEYEQMTGRKFDRVRKSIEEENTIDFLSRHNIIPKYGFPSEVVELANGDRYNTDVKIRLQRDLSRAISDYAPDSEVIADGYVVTSKYLKKFPSKDWPKYYSRECPYCGSANIMRYLGQSREEFIQQTPTCPMCSKPYAGKRATMFIIPKYGFLYKAEKHWDTVNRKPTHTYTGEIFYRGNNASKLKERDVLGHKVHCAYGRNDELVLLNKSNFRICERCGFGTTSDKINEHWTNLGHACSGQLNPRHLGHVFRTDVFIIYLDDCPIDTNDQAMSVLSALMSAFCRLFSIDDNEIGGCLSMSNGKYVFVLFDNTPGGAGYVKSTLADNDDNLLRLIRAALKMSKECTCGNGERTDCSCYGCLLNYRNQRYHDRIKRSYVIEALSNYGEEE